MPAVRRRSVAKSRNNKGHSSHIPISSKSQQTKQSRVRAVPNFGKLHQKWQNHLDQAKACTKKPCTQVEEFDLTTAGTIFRRPAVKEANSAVRAATRSRITHKEKGRVQNDDVDKALVENSNLEFEEDPAALQSILDNTGVSDSQQMAPPKPVARQTVTGSSSVFKTPTRPLQKQTTTAGAMRRSIYYTGPTSAPRRAVSEYTHHVQSSVTATPNSSDQTTHPIKIESPVHLLASPRITEVVAVPVRHSIYCKLEIKSTKTQPPPASPRTSKNTCMTKMSPAAKRESVSMPAKSPAALRQSVSMPMKSPAATRQAIAMPTKSPATRLLAPVTPKSPALTPQRQKRALSVRGTAQRVLVGSTSKTQPGNGQRQIGVTWKDILTMESSPESSEDLIKKKLNFHEALETQSRSAPLQQGRKVLGEQNTHAKSSAGRHSSRNSPKRSPLVRNITPNKQQRALHSISPNIVSPGYKSLLSPDKYNTPKSEPYQSPYSEAHVLSILEETDKENMSPFSSPKSVTYFSPAKKERQSPLRIRGSPCPAKKSDKRSGRKVAFRTDEDLLNCTVEDLNETLSESIVQYETLQNEALKLGDGEDAGTEASIMHQLQLIKEKQHQLRKLQRALQKKLQTQAEGSPPETAEREERTNGKFILEGATQQPPRQMSPASHCTEITVHRHSLATQEHLPQHTSSSTHQTSDLKTLTNQPPSTDSMSHSQPALSAIDEVHQHTKAQSSCTPSTPQEVKEYIAPMSSLPAQSRDNVSPLSSDYNDVPQSQIKSVQGLIYTITNPSATSIYSSTKVVESTSPVDGDSPTSMTEEISSAPSGALSHWKKRMIHVKPQYPVLSPEEKSFHEQDDFLAPIQTPLVMRAQAALSSPQEVDNELSRSVSRLSLAERHNAAIALLGLSTPVQDTPCSTPHSNTTRSTPGSVRASPSPGGLTPGVLEQSSVSYPSPVSYTSPVPYTSPVADTPDSVPHTSLSDASPNTTVWSGSIQDQITPSPMTEQSLTSIQEYLKAGSSKHSPAIQRHQPQYFPRLSDISPEPHIVREECDLDKKPCYYDVTDRCTPFGKSGSLSLTANCEVKRTKPAARFFWTPAADVPVPSKPHMPPPISNLAKSSRFFATPTVSTTTVTDAWHVRQGSTSTASLCSGSPLSPQSALSGSPFSSASSTRSKSSVSGLLLTATSLRFHEALLDEEVSLYASRLHTRGHSREMCRCQNPVAVTLANGDDMHFVPVHCEMSYDMLSPTEKAEGSAFAIFRSF